MKALEITTANISVETVTCSSAPVLNEVAVTFYSVVRKSARTGKLCWQMNLPLRLRSTVAFFLQSIDCKFTSVAIIDKDTQTPMSIINFVPGSVTGEQIIAIRKRITDYYKRVDALTKA